MKKEFIKQNYPIQTWINNDILRKKSKKIKNITDSIYDFSEILAKWMEIYDGIGLAAPQIWENIRMIAVCKLNKKNDKIIKQTILINPEIIEKSSKTIVEEEWCLSLPWINWKVKRNYKVKVKYTNIYWKIEEIEELWTNAWILQHEIDHLDGILFWDKIIKDEKKINLKNFLNI